MPSGSPEPEKSANQDIELVFIDPLPAAYECPVCQQVLRYPVQFDQCDHHCCSSCLPDLVKAGGQSRCPTDQQPIDRDKVYVDKQLQKNIQALRVKCSFNEKGCQWEGQLKEVPGHVPECEFAPVNCPKGCGVTYERRYQEKHNTEECEKRNVSCKHCDKEIKAMHLEEHHKACPRFPIDCPNQCGVKDQPREELRVHLDKCPKAGSACPFAEFGCQHKGERTTLQQHIREEPNKHLSLLCDGVIDLKRMLLAMQLNVERMGRRMDELGLKTDALEKLYGAQLLWKIDNYTQKFNEAKAGSKTTIFSPPFLTGRHGYKMAMSACLYGDGKVRGKSMSLFICLCRGDYDALLTWPFSHRVTFTLLDQCQDPAARRNQTYTVKPNTAKENRAFLGRPTGERNASFGAQKFCELTILEKLDYIRDDVMFIKVQVDTEDMTPL